MPKPTHSEAEAKKEYMRRWRLENAERLREYQREYDKKLSLVQNPVYRHTATDPRSRYSTRQGRSEYARQ